MSQVYMASHQCFLNDLVTGNINSLRLKNDLIRISDDPYIYNSKLSKIFYYLCHTDDKITTGSTGDAVKYELKARNTVNNFFIYILIIILDLMTLEQQ